MGVLEGRKRLLERCTVRLLPLVPRRCTEDTKKGKNQCHSLGFLGAIELEKFGATRQVKTCGRSRKVSVAATESIRLSFGCVRAMRRVCSSSTEKRSRVTCLHIHEPKAFTGGPKFLP